MENERNARRKALISLYCVILYSVVTIPLLFYYTAASIYSWTAPEDCTEGGNGVILTPFICMWLSALLANVAFFWFEVMVYIEALETMRTIYGRYVSFRGCCRKTFFFIHFTLRQNHDGYILGLAEVISINVRQNIQHHTHYLEVLTMIKQVEYQD